MAGNFIRVVCGECESEVTIFEKASTEIQCAECESIIAEPTGGLATIHGEVVGRIEEL